jgi:glycosyltransferase involved in cell wall biosynthesis
MPLAIEQLDLSEYDLIISSSHAVAKGVLVGPDQLHVSYVHSPIRYAWDFQHQYLREAGLVRGGKALLAKWILHKIRMWDYRTAAGVDVFLANSSYIARRILKTYRRNSEVLYPPVAVEDFPLMQEKEGFFLTASRQVPYKRVPLIVEAFAKMPHHQLIVIGDGPEAEKVRAAATPNVTVLGYQSFQVLKDKMQRAKAFVFAAEEDFGITPVEAQACGTPIIAFGKGGALETVRGLDSEHPTGVFFFEQTPEAICAAVELFEKQREKISPQACRENAERFSNAVFCENFKRRIQLAFKDFHSSKFD